MIERALGGVRVSGAALGVAGCVATLVLGIPAWLLANRSVEPNRVAAIISHPVTPAPAMAPDAVLPRALFGVPTAQLDATGEDANGVPLGSSSSEQPELIGIVGRLPDDAVALVRTADGGSRTVAIGGEAGGWRLAALAVDAALFVKGSERVRVALPATSD